MLCPIKVDSNTIELIVHTSCYCVLDLLCYLFFRSMKSAPGKKGVSEPFVSTSTSTASTSTSTASTSKPSRFAWSKKKRDGRNDRRKNNKQPATVDTDNSRANFRTNLSNSHSNLTVHKTISQINEEAQRRKNVYFGGTLPPVFDPTQVSDRRFSLLQWRSEQPTSLVIRSWKFG